MSTISLIANPVETSAKEVSQQANTEAWTDVKVKRVWSAAIAGVCFAAAAVCTGFAFSASLWLLAPAIPLFLASGALVWYCYSSVDYENPKELSKVREQAVAMPLPEVIEKHGYEKLFQYSILSPEQFAASYSAYADTLDLNHLISYYEETSRNSKTARNAANFHIPEPKIWKEKLISETNGLNFGALQDRTPLQKLISYGFLEPKELQDAFIAFADQIPLSEIVVRYEKALPLLKGDFSLPSPERWKEKFSGETAHLSCSEILASYRPSPETLLKYRVVSDEERQIFFDGQKAIDHYFAQEKDCQFEFDKRTERERHICAQTKELARNSYEANPTQTFLNSLFMQYMRDLNAADQTARVKIDAEQARLMQHVRSPASEDERRQLANLKLRCENACLGIKQRLELDKAYLHANYERTKDTYERKLETARRIRDQTCLLADEQYTLSTKPVREEIDEKLKNLAAEKRKKLAEINNHYESFRRANLQPASLVKPDPSV